jgi:aspartyl aminopeptidase
VAFLTGNKLKDSQVSSFKVIGCHTDSPCLKIAPRSIKKAAGYNQINVMTYGGGLWRTWFDRDLGVAGKVIIQQGDTLVSKLWNSNRPLMKVCSLAIHLDTSEEFKPNKEIHTKPILCTEVVNQLFGGDIEKIDDDKYQLDDKHMTNLTSMIASDLGVERDSIIDFELNCYDSLPSGFVGMHDEFVSSPRLDNLGSSLASLDSLIQHSKNEAVRDHSEVDMIMLFDHEEVGSCSAQGADSNMLCELTERIFYKFGGDKESYFNTIRRSFLLSADMAHGIHPNYQEKHHAQHSPAMNEGIVIKLNANQRYMTDSAGASVLKVIANKAGVPL